MFKKFYPTVYHPSIYTVDFSNVYSKGIKGLIVDIDNTLVEHDAPVNEKAIGLFKNLHSLGFKTCLISNNNEERVKPFATAVESDYIFNAHKPSKESYEKAIAQLGFCKDEVIFIGDQLFTDIFGANNIGIKSILVKPIKIDPHFYIRLKRWGEKIVIPFYKRYAKRHPEKYIL